MSTLTNAYAKEISALKLKKYRESHRKFVVEGPNFVQEALQQGLYAIESIIGTDSLYEKINVAIPDSIPKYEVDNRQLKKISSLKTPYDGLAVMKLPNNEIEVNGSLLFYMDAIQDPGNLGTIIRSADWFGIPHILLGKGSVDPFNPKCIQATMGSIFRVPISNISISELENLSKQYTICGADTEGIPIKEYKLEEPTIIVIGNEGRGITKSTLPFIKNRISIPSAESRHPDSLNAGISASIFMYELSNKKSR